MARYGSIITIDLSEIPNAFAHKPMSDLSMCDIGIPLIDIHHADVVRVCHNGTCCVIKDHDATNDLRLDKLLVDIASWYTHATADENFMSRVIQHMATTVMSKKDIKNEA